MAGKHSISKKHSAASGPPEPLTFFIDAALGRVMVADALRREGLNVVLHDEVFPQGSPDEEWLPGLGRRGWVLLTKDDRIRSTTAQREILLAAGVRAFILSGANLPGPTMAEAFRTAAKRMQRVALGERHPFIARVTPSGEVRLLVRGRFKARR